IAGNVSIERERSRRGIDVLRRERARLVPARSWLRAQNFARHQARRPPGGTAGQIRAGRQPQNRQGARVFVTARDSRPRRRGDRVKRREFITLLGGAAVAWPLAVRAQQGDRLSTIGFLGQSTRSAASEWVAAFVPRLRELGWTEGRTISIEDRWSEGRAERAAQSAAEFVRLKVNVIVTSGTPQTLATKQATSIIPIVFATAGDPVGNGLVANLARSGGNITGLSLQSNDIAGKRIELLREIVPGLRRLAILANVGNPFSVLELGEAQAAARALGLEVGPLEIRRPEDIAPGFEALKGRAEALYVCTDGLVNANRIRINTSALSATSDHARLSRLRRSGRSDVLWSKPPGPVPAFRRLCRQNSARGKA